MIRKTYSESTQIRPRTAHTPTVASHVDVFILGDCTGIDGSIDRDRLHPISAINVSIVTKFRTTAHEEAQRVKTTSKSSSERRKCCFMTLRLFFTSQSPHQRTLAPHGARRILEASPKHCLQQLLFEPALVSRRVSTGSSAEDSFLSAEA